MEPRRLTKIGLNIESELVELTHKILINILLGDQVIESFSDGLGVNS